MFCVKKGGGVGWTIRVEWKETKKETEVLCCYKKQQLELDMEQQTGSK